MRDQRKPKSCSTILGVLQDIVELVSGFRLFPEHIALGPAPGRRKAVPGTRRRRPPGPKILFPLLMGLVLVAATPTWSAPLPLPAGAPDLYEPGVLEHFQLGETGNLRENPDFPVLLLVNPTSTYDATAC
jgi:hypothetical protein